MGSKFYNSTTDGLSNGLSVAVNGCSKDETSGTGPEPLRIAIVGAGIGGLTAAIGLRRNGHNVSVSISAK
jgi:hypothetical protein